MGDNIGFELLNSDSFNNYSGDESNKTRETSKIFLSLKSHIDCQFKLNRLNKSRIQLFERFRRYCQRVDDDDDNGTKFDLEQFRNEYNRFDRNYRHWRKRFRMLRKETKSLSNQNPYDMLYELFAKIEILERNNDKLNKDSEDVSSVHYNSSVNSQSLKEQSIRYDFFDGRPAKFTTKCPSGISSKSKDSTVQYLLPEQLYSEILINDIEPPELFKNLLGNNALNSESSSYSSDRSYDISKTKSRKRTIYAKKKLISTFKQSDKKDKIETKTRSNAKYQKKEALGSDCPDPFRKKRGCKAKKLKTEKEVHHCDEEDCQYSTTIWSNLKTHMKSHSDERPFQCDKCDKSYKLKARLDLHKNVHEGKRFQCTFEGCNRNYSIPEQLQKHIKIVHTKEAPLLNCDWEGCQYGTYRRENLNTHQKIHKGQREYKCPHCEMAFNAPSSLWGHRLKHENIGGFKCDFEGCQFSTHRKSLLKNHQLTHFEERLFSCAWPGCGDSFKTPACLASHKLMHENLRRYKCSWDGCNYASNKSSGLTGHIQGVHEKRKRITKPKRGD